MKLSIIIPVYNVEDYVQCTIESCLDQDFDSSNYEIICVNDGSTDASLDVLKRFQHRSNLRIISQENKGVSVARNRGLKEAKGEFVWFVDSDDYIMKNSISQIAAIVDRHPDFDMIQLGFERTDSNINRSIERNIEILKTFPFGVMLNEFLPKEERGFPFAYWVRRSVIQKNNLEFAPNVIMCEDENFNFYLRKYVKNTAFVSTPVYFYRTRESSVTNNIHKKSHVKQYIASRIELATFNTDKMKLCQDESIIPEIDERILYDVQGAISMAISTGELKYIKTMLDELKERRLYPYKASYKNIIPHGNLRKYLIDILAVLYPCRACVYSFGMMYKFVNIFHKE